MSYSLIGYKSAGNARLAKIMIASKYAGINIDVQHVVDMDPAQKPSYQLNCHPLGASPVLQTEEGYLFESGAILRHVARSDKNNAFLYGRSTFEASQVDAWLDFVTTELDPYSLTPVLMALGLMPKCDDKLGAAMQAGLDALSGVESWLEIRTFLVGERITIADIALATAAHQFLGAGECASPIWAKCKNVLRHYNTMMAQANVIAGYVALGGDGAAASKPKEEKKAAAPAPAAKPKEEKPKAAAKPEEDEEDEPAIEEPKKKNPLDELPPSAFVMDAWKREYSNKDTRKEAAPWFFQNFDNAGYTAFYCKYKYNTDLKKQFMTANLIRGWFQRMEGNRKYAFGVAMINGTDTVHEVTAFWIFRGKGLPECVKDVEDTELFDWVEIADVNAEKDRITDYLAWEGPSFATPVLEGRAFK